MTMGSYKLLPAQETERIIAYLLDRTKQGFSVSGTHRQQEWIDGWNAVRERYNRTRNIEDLRPVFPSVNETDEYRQILRYKGKFIQVEGSASMFHVKKIEEHKRKIFSKYLTDRHLMIDIGCGPFTNVITLINLFEGIDYIGMDWYPAISDFGELVSANTGSNLVGIESDMFNPVDMSVDADKIAVITSGSLEQMGKDYGNILAWIISIRPEIIIHFETMMELYDPENTVDYTAIEYLKARNYLQGYYTELISNPDIEILHMERTFGCRYHEGETALVWRLR